MLDAFGASGAQARAEARDLAACRAMLGRGSRGLLAAGLALPARVRDPATAVYAFRRVLGEVVERPGATPAVVDTLVARTRRAFAGQPDPHPVDRAFSRAMTAHGVPEALFDALLEGLAWDLAGRRYATYEALLGYAARVAGSMAACLCVLMDRRHPEVVARACELGIAIELTGIARDVGPDARNGRVYLPLEWLEEARVDVDRFILEPTPTRGARDAVMRLVRAADPLYARAERTIDALPADCRPAVRGVRLVFGALGDELRKAGWDSISRRVAVGPLEIARITARSLRASSAEREPHPPSPPLRATAFLVDAVAR
jgi:phytoene synthase